MVTQKKTKIPHLQKATLDLVPMNNVCPLDAALFMVLRDIFAAHLV